MNSRGRSLGIVTDGSFNGGLTVRLNPTCQTEDLRVGSFVVLEGDRNAYFSLITDIRLRASDQALHAAPPDSGSDFVRRALGGTATYATVEVRPSLMLENSGSRAGDGPVPVRTIPPHFAELREAEESDLSLVFGEESATHFALGHPPTMDIPIPLNLKEFIERSNGVFGQSGTGKSVLTRLLLFGLIKSNLASTLIFDMHNEYATASPDRPGITGLRDLFGDARVKVFTLDSSTDRSAGARDVLIGLDQIEPEDIELLATELNLTPTFAQTSYALSVKFGGAWLRTLLDMDGGSVAAFCADTGAHQGAVDALRNKLQRLRGKPYIADSVPHSAIDEMLRHIERGSHVILQFGRHDSFLDYMLVANIVTRRIHDQYTQRVLQRATGESRRLVIVLEEAHKFLTTENARQSIFGTIAREMRKYYVTLLIVDQRPSDIDPEILSQLGTKITGALSEQRDIDAVLTGVADRAQMRGMLASLRPRQECILLGHAVPMPIMLRTRTYEAELLKSELSHAGISRPTGREALSLLNDLGDTE